ncbi:hypothetical protein [Thaumasiovibrio subtropicus]|uniref:hypothetical protein n=1 Tax=Thaumasiovibrio subtropicus TaxID=1891207 RepID=UPI000B351746|nr:hypothetical protein [Thaumasiovibrio subtropicus]
MRSKLVNFTLIIFYTLLLGALYQVLLSWRDIDAQGEVAVLEIDKRLDAMFAELEGFRDVPDVCSSEFRLRAQRQVYTSLDLRSIVVGYPEGEFPNFCGGLGSYSQRLDSNFWHFAVKDDYVMGLLKVTAYRDDPSVAIGQYHGEAVTLGIVNPRIMLGRWLEPFQKTVSIRLYLDDRSHPILSRAAQAQPSRRHGFSHREITNDFSSEKYPYSVSVSMSYGIIAEHIIEFAQRLVKVIAVLILVALIAVIGLIQFGSAKREIYSK